MQYAQNNPSKFMKSVHNKYNSCKKSAVYAKIRTTPHFLL